MSLAEYNLNKKTYTDIANKFDSVNENVTQLNAETNKEYMLLIIWFIITIFICIITLLTIISESGLNPIVLIIVILFLLYMLYYFMNNIYFMFK
jgi:hypothetical protein